MLRCAPPFELAHLPVPIVGEPNSFYEVRSRESGYSSLRLALGASSNLLSSASFAWHSLCLHLSWAPRLILLNNIQQLSNNVKGLMKIEPAAPGVTHVQYSMGVLCDNCVLGVPCR